MSIYNFFYIYKSFSLISLDTGPMPFILLMILAMEQRDRQTVLGDYITLCMYGLICLYFIYAQVVRVYRMRGDLSFMY